MPATVSTYIISLYYCQTDGQKSLDFTEVDSLVTRTGCNCTHHQQHHHTLYLNSCYCNSTLQYIQLVWHSGNCVRHIDEDKLRCRRCRGGHVEHSSMLSTRTGDDLWRVYHPAIYPGHSALPSLCGQQQWVPEMVSAISGKKQRFINQFIII